MDDNYIEYGVYWASVDEPECTPVELKEFQVLATELAKEELEPINVVQF